MKQVGQAEYFCQRRKSLPSHFSQKDRQIKPSQNRLKQVRKQQEEWEGRRILGDWGPIRDSRYWTPFSLLNLIVKRHVWPFFNDHVQKTIAWANVLKEQRGFILPRIKSSHLWESIVRYLWAYDSNATCPLNSCFLSAVVLQHGLGIHYVLSHTFTRYLTGRLLLAWWFQYLFHQYNFLVLIKSQTRC